MNPKFALAVLVLLAAGTAAFFLFGTDPRTGPLETGRGDPGTANPAANSTAAGRAADTQKGKRAAGAADATERREAVQGGAGAEPARDGLVLLAGRLVDGGGAPLQTGVSFRENRFGPGAIATGRDVADLPEPARVEGRSRADGRFALHVPPNQAGILRVAGEELVIARADAGVGLHVRVGPQDTDIGDVRVVPAAQVSGRVVADGRGVGGVEIVHGRDPVLAPGSFFSEDRVAKTGADGRFLIRGLVPGTLRMHTRSPDYLPARHALELTAGQRVTDVVIKLSQGGVISGTVVDDRGQPVEGAMVAAARSRKLGENVEYSGFSTGESTKTDAGGQFRLAGLAEPSVQVRANKAGYAAGQVADAKAGQSNVVLNLPRLGAVSGVLVDDEGGPIAGSEIEVRPERRAALMAFASRSLARSAKDGSFTVEGVAPGRNEVVATGDGHLDVAEGIDVRPGETTSGVRLVARRGATLTVTVVDDAGAPVAGAEVIVTTPSTGPAGAWRQGGGGRAGARRAVRREVRRERRNGRTVTRILGQSEKLGSVKTDDAGVAVVGGLPAGAVEVTAKHRELALLEPAEAELPDGGKASAKLAMQRGGFIDVSVADTRGRPLGEKKLTVIGPLLGGDAEPARATHTADKEGNVKVGPLAPGSYKAVLAQDARIRSMGPGMSFSLAGDDKDLADSTAPCVVKASESTAVKLVMPILTTVRGAVRDANGPVAGAEVEMVPEGEIRMPMLGKYKARTDPTGKFSIEGLPSGKYALEYNRKGGVVPASKDVVLVKDQAILEEELVIPGAVIKLRAKDGAEGYGVEEAKVALRKFVEPGPGAAPRQRRMMMVGITANVSSGGSPSTFKMSSGAPAVKSDENGRVEIRDVPAGKYTLTVEHPEYAKVTRVVQVAGDQAKDLGDVALHVGCRVRGRVQFATKGPLNLANVEIRNASGYSETQFSQDGTFRFNGLAAGTYEVRAQAIGSGEAKWGPAKTVEVTPDKPARVTVQVPKSD